MVQKQSALFLQLGERKHVFAEHTHTHTHKNKTKTAPSPYTFKGNRYQFLRIPQLIQNVFVGHHGEQYASSRVSYFISRAAFTLKRCSVPLLLMRNKKENKGTNHCCFTNNWKANKSPISGYFCVRRTLSLRGCGILYSKLQVQGEKVFQHFSTDSCLPFILCYYSGHYILGVCGCLPV